MGFYQLLAEQLSPGDRLLWSGSFHQIARVSVVTKDYDDIRIRVVMCDIARAVYFGPEDRVEVIR